MTGKQKKLLYRIIAAAVLLIVVSFLPIKGLWQLAAYLVPYLIVGFAVLKKAAVNIAHGQIFDENFLMAIASVGAFVTGEYQEAAAVMLFYQVGELFESIAVGKSRRNIAELMEIRPDVATVERNGEPEQVDPEEVSIGEIIVVEPGERIPLDGTVIEGTSLINTAALTGESLPREAQVGATVFSGCIALNGVLRIRVEKAFAESTVSRILELVENAAERKAKTESFITRFARWYTPCVCTGALLVAVIPSLITGNWLKWLHRALIFLVVSCPCALVISVPLSFFGGIGGASKKGILIKGSNELEKLARIDTVVFDKTGTLTQGTFSVDRVEPVGIAESELLGYAALAESHSNHPIAVSLREAARQTDAALRLSDVHEFAGHGVSAQVDGKTVLVGNAKLMYENGFEVGTTDGTTVHVAVDGHYVGQIHLSDTLKPNAAESMRMLKNCGVNRLVMLTGDSAAAAEKVAKTLGLDEVHSELLPAGKVTQIEHLMQRKTASGCTVFVGDGINDAPVLMRSDVGIAMGALGSDAAIEAADVVLMNDHLEGIAEAVQISRKTMRIVWENIVFSLGVKALVLLLGTLGIAGMWSAVFADVGVCVIAILNAMRTGLHFGK